MLFDEPENNPAVSWKCGVCGKVFYREKKRIHLSISRHINLEYDAGLREEPYNLAMEWDIKEEE